MAVTVQINSSEIEATSYSLKEDSTPIYGGDTNGSVGEFTVEIPTWAISPVALHYATITLQDSQYGEIEGRVDSASRDDSTGLTRLQCVAKTGLLAAYNVKAEPFTGSLLQAIRYYLNLADTSFQFTLSEISDNLFQQVSFIGWEGELWLHLKKLAQAHGLEIALVAGVLQFRRPLLRSQSIENVSGSSVTLGDNNLAEKAEYVWFETRPLVNECVYPPHKDLETTQMYSVTAGQETEIILQMAASVKSIQQPVFRETVAPNWFSASNISLSTESGRAVTYGEWSRGGGAARVEIQEDDDTKLKLIVRGPTGVSDSGSAAFRLAVAKTTTHAEYSSIRLVGTGVGFTEHTITCPTGVQRQRAASETAPTERNIFTTDAGRAWELCTSIAQKYSMPSVNMSINSPRLGVMPLGVAPGVRIFDEGSHHWFRVRSLEYEQAEMSASAEWGSRHTDAAKKYAGMTYGEVQVMHQGKTYSQVTLEGV